MKIDKSLLSGNTPMLILALLKDGDKYGYEMVDELARRSDNTFELKEGTLYPLLHTLEKNKLVTSYTKATPGGRERKYYQLTEEGREQLETKTKEWRMFTEKVNAVLGAVSPALS
jgi:PadR family transcriptional regulator PadR